MAITNVENAPKTSATGAGRQRKEADGWLNLKVKDATGAFHNIQAYIPLHSDVRLHRALMHKGATPDVEIQLIGTINIVDKNAPEIEL